jgi:ABC-type transport system involved in multi-copper enzyme maturation permease subunit
MLQQLRSRIHSPFSPLTAQELRSRMRNPRAYAVLTIYMSIVSGITLLIYLVASANGNSGVNDSSRVGTALFYIVVGMQTLLVSFVAPSFTATAISGERENQTYDLLRMTLVSPRQIILSKLFSAFGYTGLLVFATLPLLSLALLLGGVEIIQVAAAVLVILASALLFSVLGLYVSSRMRTTLGATLVTYALTLGIVLGMAVLTLIAFPLLNGILYGTSSIVKTSPLLASLIQVLLMGLVSLSPISAMVASETNLQESGNALIVTINPLPGTTTPFSFPAPFVILLVFYLAASIILIALSIRHASKPGDQD